MTNFYCNVTLFVPVLSHHGALECSKGIISLSERILSSVGNKYHFYFPKKYLKYHRKCNIRVHQS